MIYLDNAATTQVCPEAVNAATAAMTDLYANPASLHAFGIEAEKRLDQSRQIIAEAAGVLPEELYFTAGGTVSNNTAVFGALSSMRGGRIICSAYEHPSVLECFKQLENRFDVVYLPPAKSGCIKPDDLLKALTQETRLVSIMHVNNETGAINPIRELAKITKTINPKTLFHTDAVQGFLKEPFSYSCADMASFSAHKTHAPKGIGALYIKKGVHIKPVILGGGQEKGIYSGTSNVPGAAAWAAAVRTADVEKNRQTVLKLNQECRRLLQQLGAQILSPENASPYIISTIFHGYMAETLLRVLAQNEIYVSTGSACSSKHGSHVYRTLGLQSVQKNILRISFSELNTLEEIKILQHRLSEALTAIEKKI